MKANADTSPINATTPSQTVLAHTGFRAHATNAEIISSVRIGNQGFVMHIIGIKLSL